MSKKQTDDFGVEIEVGDIILSSPQNSKAAIGRVERVSSSGRITIKHKIERAIHAYERGAPDIPYEAERAKRDERGRPVETGRNHWGSVYAYEKYTAYRKDYTVVGRREEWVKTQCAEISRIVLRKSGHTMLDTLDMVKNLIHLDYDAELGEIE